jgi:murein DD-endopeptidase MepM/ murein hydrolase activator NlpD
MLFVVASPIVKAQTLNDMNKELEKLKSELATANSSKKLTESEIANLKTEISTINSNITKTRSEIKTAEQEIANSEQEIENKKEECNQLLQTLQLSSDENAYLEYIIEADSYTDMIYRYAIVSQMTNNNNKIMDELNTAISNLEKKQAELTSKQKSLESEQAELSSKLITLNANLTEITTEGTSIEEDIEYLEKQIDYYKNTMGCSMNQDVTTCKKTYSSGVVVEASGWKLPISRGVVTSEWIGSAHRTDVNIGYDGHYGIDLGTAEGSEVYAAAAGEVARIVYRGSCGGNQIYIYHTVNGQKTTTAYLHLLEIKVSEHQIVDENTIIALSGGGSTASVNGGYDRCTTGAHLHFGMANGWHAESFSAYSFNPRTIFNFPAQGVYFYR